EVGAQLIGLGAPTADDDARTSGVDVDAQAIARPLHLDAADRRIRELVHQVVADLPVLDEVVDVLLTSGEPAGLPVGGDTEAEAVGIDLLTHQSSFFSASPA